MFHRLHTAQRSPDSATSRADDTSQSVIRVNVQPFSADGDESTKRLLKHTADGRVRHPRLPKRNVFVGLYAGCVCIGWLLYDAGIHYGYGGDTFHWQLLAIVAAVLCLCCAAYTAYRQHFLRVLTALPLLVPFAINGYSFYYIKQSATNLSDSICLILFTLFTVALISLVLLLYAARYHKRQTAILALCIVLAASLLQWRWYRQAKDGWQCTLDYDGDGQCDPIVSVLQSTLSATELQQTLQYCPLPAAHTHPLDLLPARTMNFFTGSMQCSSGDNRFTRLDDMVLHVDCNSASSYTVVTNNRFSLSADPEMTRVLKLMDRDFDASTRSEFESTMTIVDLHQSRLHHIDVYCGSQHDYILVQQTAPAVAKHGKVVTAVRAKASRNVVVIYIDALSRRHMHRRLPQTVRKIELLHQQQRYNAVELLKYHTVDYHTRANLQGLMCNSNIRVGEACRAADILWGVARRAGYTSTFIDNSCEDTIGQYMINTDADWQGTVSSPSKYGQFSASHERVASFCHTQYAEKRSSWSNVRGPYSLSRRCIAERNVHTYVLDDLRQFVGIHEAEGVPYVAWAHMMEAHEGSMEVVGSMDNELAATIEWAAALPSKPAVLLVSDHGNHMGINGLTRGGLTEQRLPAAIFMLPRHTELDTPQIRAAMDHNRNALLTSKDIHLTLRNIVEGSSYSGPASIQQSLFQPLPYDRSCQQLNIPDDICLCRPSPSVNIAFSPL